MPFRSIKSCLTKSPFGSWKDGLTKVTAYHQFALYASYSVSVRILAHKDQAIESRHMHFFANVSSLIRIARATK